MNHENLNNMMSDAVEEELKRQMGRIDPSQFAQFHSMLSYHMGWSDEDGNAGVKGKRLRPKLLLMTSGACGTDWHLALPAAAAVEFIHNFSLVHDDIEDNSTTRHGRTTVWKKWGMPQGVNAGDALFILSSLALTDLSPTAGPELALRAITILQQTCLDLSCGQYLDMSFESRSEVTIEEYWEMASRKTASLFAASCEIGAILGTTDQEKIDAYRSFGHYLGLAFQIQDDMIGIWGNSEVSGKSNETDLVDRKKTFPVLYALTQRGEFAQRWEKKDISADEVPGLALQLTREGVLLYTKGISDNLTNLAKKSLQIAEPQGATAEMLFEIVESISEREY